MIKDWGPISTRTTRIEPDNILRRKSVSPHTTFDTKPVVEIAPKIHTPNLGILTTPKYPILGTGETQKPQEPESPGIKMPEVIIPRTSLDTASTSGIVNAGKDTSLLPTIIFPKK